MTVFVAGLIGAFAVELVAACVAELDAAYTARCWTATDCCKIKGCVIDGVDPNVVHIA